MTILDASVKALEKKGVAMSSDEIYAVIIEHKLFEFKAKDPKSILRSTLRKHLKSNGPHRIEEVSKGVFRKI